ncbi:MAG TPA: hypothetical protein VEL79_20250 [Vicinamibacterales bacterium]|nr:hypothetical protein [Vicinamibacterales bacterium]
MRDATEEEQDGAFDPGDRERRYSTMNLMYFWTIRLLSAFDALQMVTSPLLPPGTNVYATTSVSQINTLFFGNSPDPTFTATAFIWSWTVYEQDGSQSPPQSPPDFFQNAVRINNCATVTFAVFVERAWTYALLNVFSV